METRASSLTCGSISTTRWLLPWIEVLKGLESAKTSMVDRRSLHKFLLACLPQPSAKAPTKLLIHLGIRLCCASLRSRTKNYEMWQIAVDGSHFASSFASIVLLPISRESLPMMRTTNHQLQDSGPYFLGTRRENHRIVTVHTRR